MLSVIDVILQAVLGHFVSQLFPPVPGAYVGGGPKTSAQHIHLHSRLIIEKSNDNHGQGVIAQADIRKSQWNRINKWDY